MCDTLLLQIGSYFRFAQGLMVLIYSLYALEIVYFIAMTSVYLTSETPDFQSSLPACDVGLSTPPPDSATLMSRGIF